MSLFAKKVTASRARIEKSGARATVFIAWPIDEEIKSTLATVEQELAADRNIKELVVDIGETEKINSVGVKEWIAAFDRFDRRYSCAYERCTSAFMDMAVMVPSLIKKRPIRAFVSCYACPDCQTEISAEVRLRGGVAERPTLPRCKRCGVELAPDPDLEADVDFALGKR